MKLTRKSGGTGSRPDQWWRWRSSRRDTAQMGDEVRGGPPDKQNFWQRFSSQETGPQRLIVGIAGTVTAVATAVGGVYAVTNVVSGDESSTATESTATSPSPPEVSPSSGSTTDLSTPSGSPSPSSSVSTRPGQTLIAQGSPEADDFVRAFVDADGGRVNLDVVILARERDPTPQWIMGLWYNCQGLPPGDPPGEDLCDEAVLVFDDAKPSPTRYDRPRRIELQGIWADNRPTGLGYGAGGLEFYLTQASF